MHNRKKLERPPTEAEIAALQKKTQTYASLVGIIFERRKQGDKSADTFNLVGKMIRNNPDFYTLFNFRREILHDMYPQLVECGYGNKYNGDNADQMRDEELTLSADGIVRNPKSYGAWHHRRWVISKFNVDFEKELALCKEFLRQDQRNFHCWNYRRFVISVANVPAEAELAYSLEKIQENFSNYSAFHHRSNFIKSNAASLTTVLPEEFSIVENAIFTEPDDQSAWWYHQFLLTWAVNDIKGKRASGATEEAAALAVWLVGVLQQQMELIHSLYELETTCTWVMNCLVSMIDLLASDLLAPVATNAVDVQALLAERCELLEKLVVVDPNHKHRYNYQLLHANVAK